MQKVLAAFAEGSSVRADGLCIDCPRLLGSSKAGKSNMKEFLSTTLYEQIYSSTECKYSSDFN